MTPLLALSKVGKRFGNGTTALIDIHLEVAEGEIVAVVGASGCGKSTLLRLIAGLETATGGDMRITGRPIIGPSPEIGVVFQEPRLMPWLDARANAAFGLGGLPRRERRARADEALARVGLAAAAGSLPQALSGGMAQRAALARALVTRPRLLLLDEPFSALDAFTRQELQDQVLELAAEDRRTMLLVTHDLDEAVVMADRVIVLGSRPGRVVAEIAVRLPRPRRRTSLEFQAVVEQVLTSMPRHLPAAA